MALCYNLFQLLPPKGTTKILDVAANLRYDIILYQGSHPKYKFFTIIFHILGYKSSHQFSVLEDNVYHGCLLTSCDI